MPSLLTLGLFATGLPAFLGVLMAYSVVAIILGFFLWASRSFPDDIAQSIVVSGLFTGLLLVLGALVIRFIL